MRHALAILFLSLPALARGPGKHTQDYHQGANASASSSGALARYLTPTGDTVSFSGVTFTRASAGAACTDAAGAITFPASGVPCLEGGYHARPSISNLLVQTSAFGAAAWSSTGGTITANSVTAPDGTTTGDTYAPTASTDHLFQNFTTSTGGGYTLSIYLKKVGTAGSARVQIWDSTGAASLASCAITPTAAWVRYSCSVASTTSGHVIQAALYADTSGGGNAVYLWGAQAESGAFANDYCPSTSTAATCAAEVATVPTPSGMSLTEGCARYCVTPPFTGANPSVGNVFFLGGNAANTARLGYSGPGATSVTVSDGTHFGGVAASFAAGTRSCFLARWSVAGSSLRVANVTTGAESTPVAFSGFPSLNSTLRIGGNGTGGDQPLGAILDSIVIGASPEACR